MNLSVLKICRRELAAVSRRLFAVVPVVMALVHAQLEAGGLHDKSALKSDVRDRCFRILREGLVAEEFWPGMHAAEALSLAGHGKEVVDALRDRLEAETDDQRRCGLVRELVRAGDRSHLPVLFQILAQEGSTGRVHAAESLFKLNEVGDRKALNAAFQQDQNVQLRLMSAAALARAGDQPAMAFLRQSLRSEVRTVRNTAAWALFVLGDASDVPSLRSALAGETDAWSRCLLANALARNDDESGRELQLVHLNSTEPAVRAMTAEAVGHCGEMAFQKELTALLNDPLTDPRIRAAQALLLLSGKSAKGEQP